MFPGSGNIYYLIFMYIPAILLLDSLSYVLIERPFHKLRRKTFAPRRSTGRYT